jgi:hypothetical protein
MSDETEEVILNEFDKSWGRPMPVKLITYDDSTMDIHRQTGSQFDEHIEKAKDILKSRGLEIVNENSYFIGPTGCYMSVEPIDRTRK